MKVEVTNKISVRMNPFPRTPTLVNM